MELLSFEETKKLLKQYKIPLIQTKIIRTKKEAVIFAQKFDYPIVLKILASDIIHKTEKGLVENKICNKKELDISFQRLSKKRKLGKNSFLLIQKKGEGIELIVGMKRDPVFGPILMFGLGGVFVELFKKNSFGIAPLSKKEARKMIKDVQILDIAKKRGLLSQGAPLLKERSSFFGVDDILVKISKIAEEYPKIKEIDFNPIFVGAKETLVVDAKFLVDEGKAFISTFAFTS